MTPASHRPVRRALLVVCVLCTALRVGAASQAVSPSALKAAFVYNFAKFTEWPAEALAPSASIQVCVIGDKGVAASLVDLTAGRDLSGHTFEVREVSSIGSVLFCNVVYASGLDDGHRASLLERLENAPVLSVSDQDGFAKAGGVANFFLEDGKMRFVVNVDVVARGGLRLSSRLLSLAEVVKE